MKRAKADAKAKTNAKAKTKTKKTKLDKPNKPKLDKTVFGFESKAAAEKSELAALKKMSYQEKSRTITYLRECFYGEEATTGRLQRVFEVTPFPPR